MYYVCVRLDIKLIGNAQLYQKLNMFREVDVVALRDGTKIDRFRNFKEAANLGLFSVVKFTIIPLDPQVVVEPYGKSYSSYVPFSGGLTFDSVKVILNNHIFSFSSDERLVEYTVVPGFVKIKRTANTRGGS